MYCSNGAAAFMAPLMEEYQTEYPDISLFLCGDSGFATGELYSLCETNGTSYAIRLKENAALRRLAIDFESESDVFGKAATAITSRLLDNPTEKITDVSTFRTKGMKATDEEVLAAVDGELCVLNRLKSSALSVLTWTALTSAKPIWNLLFFLFRKSAGATKT